MPIGTEISAAMPVMMSVPTTACQAPGVATTSRVFGSNVIPPTWVTNCQLRTPMPLMNTVSSVETSGMRARRKAAVTSPRTTRSVARRRPSTIVDPTPMARR